MRAIAYASLNGVELTRSVAAKALSDIFAPREVEVDPQEIVRKVAEHFALRPEDLLGGGRRKEVVLPRQIAMYLVRELTRASLPEIGQLFGGRDHTTVLYAIQKIQELAESDGRSRAPEVPSGGAGVTPVDNLWITLWISGLVLWITLWTTCGKLPWGRTLWITPRLSTPYPQAGAGFPQGLSTSPFPSWRAFSPPYPHIHSSYYYDYGSFKVFKRLSSSSKRRTAK